MNSNKIIKNIRSRKGITLVALVITIIILLILAGIAISQLTENGLFQKTSDSAIKHEKAELKEKILLEIMAKQAENKGILTQQVAEKILEKYGTINKNTDETIKSLTPEGKDYEIPFNEIYSGEVINFKITYVANNGTGIIENTNGIVVSNEFTPPSGKQFKEWNTQANGNGTKYTIGATVEEDITLYAIWEDIIYTVTYVGNGSTEGTTTSNPGTSVTIATNGFTEPDGYVFKNWNTEADGSGDSYTPGQSVSEDLELFAIWIEPPQWTLTDNGTTGLNRGDLLTPTITGLANEQFYVINVGTGTDPVVTLLAKQNVNTSTKRQGSGNSVLFDSNGSKVYANSTIKGLVKNYTDVLEGGGLVLENVETVEGGSAVTGTKGRLMWKSEADTLLNNSYSGIVYRPLGGNIRYWLGTPHNNALKEAWCVYDGMLYQWNADENNLTLRSSSCYKSLSIKNFIKMIN